MASHLPGSKNGNSALPQFRAAAIPRCRNSALPQFTALVLLLGLAACSPEHNLDPTLPHGDQGQSPTLSPAELLTGLMAQAGCATAPPKSGNSEVTVPLPDGSPVTFDCGATPRSEIREAVRRYREALGPSELPSLTTWYEDVVVYFQCQVTHYWNYVPAMGEYVYAYSTVDGCWVTEIVRSSGGGGGGGGGTWLDENNSPTTPPSPPYEPPMESDTVCFDVTNDRQVLRRIGTTDYVVQGALNDLAIQDSLRTLLYDSFGTLQNPLPMSQRRELGGVIVFNPNNNTYSFQRIPSLSQWESHCTYAAGPAKILGVLVGAVHTHPIPDGETYDCPLTDEYGLVANAEGSGGGSEEDWDSATSLGVPMYTVDPYRIWRLEPDTPSGSARTGNPQRWLYGTTATCSSTAPF